MPDVTTEVERPPVGQLQDVLAAISDPVRLEMVRRLHRNDGTLACSLLYDDISKSTASHHFKILREAGVTERSMVAGQTHQNLRLDDVEACYPGVLASILAVEPADL
jgi:DNA-binding transcriptional ArsR family regulator